MPSVIKDVFKGFWSIFIDVFITGFFVLAFLVYYKFINISEKTMFAFMSIGYGLVAVAGTIKMMSRRRQEQTGEIDSERTLVLTHGNMFLMEIFALLAAIGVLVIIYMSNEKLTTINIIQSLFIFGIVKFINWYYMKQQI